MKNTPNVAGKRYIFFIGTLAEFIKIFPIMKRFKDLNVPFEIIASGQNDIENSEIFSYLELEKANLKLSGGPKKKTALSLFSWFVKTFFSSIFVIRKYLKDTKTDKDPVMIVHGDTVSTLMGAYVAKILGVKVAHIEAGLRSFNIFHPFPEEINRVLTSKVVDKHFCPNEWAVNNLKNLKGEKINTLNNTLLESLHLSKEIPTPDNIKILLNKKPFFIFVVHRQENLYNSQRLNNFINDMLDLSNEMHCIFILHEPAKVALESAGLLEKITSVENITVLPRQGYFDFMKLIDSCEFFVTDGGSNQEEAYYFGKPCLILRNHTERLEGLDKNVLLWQEGENSVKDFGKNYMKYKCDPVYFDVPPSKIICESL